MRFERVEAIGVGGLEDETLDLAPGLTVVHGLNEAGKSTWHAALLAGWVGQRRGRGKPRGPDAEFKEQYEPWSGADLEAAVDVVTDAGRRIRFRRNLSDLTDFEVVDGANSDVASEFLHEQTPDGALLLGLTRETVRSTICVSQADVLSVRDGADGLQKQLQRAAANAGASDTTAKMALDRLAEFQRDHVGTDRRNAVKPLRAAIDARDAAYETLRTAREQHDHYLALRADRDEAADQVEELETRYGMLSRSLAAAGLVADRARLERLRALQERVDGAADLDTPADSDVQDAVAQARVRYADRPEVPDVTPGPGVDELQAELDALPERPAGDLDPDPTVEAAHQGWWQARASLSAHDANEPTVEPAPPLEGRSPDELFADARLLDATPVSVDPALEAEITRLDEQLAAASGRSPMVLAATGGAGIAAVVGAALLATGPAVAGAVLLAVAVALAAVALSRRGGGASDPQLLAARARAQADLAAARQRVAEDADSRRRVVDRLRDSNLPADPDELRRLATAARNAEWERDQHTRWERERDHHRKTLVRAAERLRQALSDRGVDVAVTGADEYPTTIVEAAWEQYETDCRARKRQAEQAARRRDLEQRIAAAREIEQSRRQQQALRVRATEDLVRLARDLGFAGPDRQRDVGDGGGDTAEVADHADRFLADWLEVQRRLEQQWDEVRQARTSLASALDDDETVERLADDVAGREVDLAGVTPATEVDATRAELVEVERYLEKARDEAQELRGRLTQFERDLLPVAEAEEATHRADAELARVRRLQQTLERTTSFLESAQQQVHQDIAPVLQDAIARHLPALTRGRYERVRVVPETLDVTVEVDGRFRSATALSHGTAEQIYLLLRVALADRLVTTGETAPLVLDDVTVQFDEHRTVRTLQMLADIAADRQVVLFSQEREVLQWAREHLTSSRDRLVELPDPASATR